MLHATSLFCSLRKSKVLIPFEELGIKKFVAIALEKPLDLAWLKLNEDELAPELMGRRMEELNYGKSWRSKMTGGFILRMLKWWEKLTARH